MRGPPGRGSRLRRQHKGGLRGDHAASNPSPRPSEARGPTTGCTAGARCPRGHSAGAGGSRGSGQQAHRGRRPRRGRAGTRSRSRTLPGRTPPLRPPLLSSWVGRLRRSLSRAGPRGTDALWAHEWAVRSEGSPSPARPPPDPHPLPAVRREGAWEEAQHSGSRGHRAAIGWFRFCRVGRSGVLQGVPGTSPTAEAWLPPAHVDVLLGTLLGIVGQGAAHGFPTGLSPTACWGPRTVGKEAGLVVLSRGDLQRKDSP